MLKRTLHTKYDIWYVGLKVELFHEKNAPPMLKLGGKVCFLYVHILHNGAKCIKRMMGVI